MRLTLLYFASVREKVGTGEEVVEVPDSLETVADLVAWLKTRSDGHALAFEQTGTMKVALNQEHVGFDALLSGAEEIAFFPPVTGG